MEAWLTSGLLGKRKGFEMHCNDCGAVFTLKRK